MAQMSSAIWFLQQLSRLLFQPRVVNVGLIGEE
jgi:hypothetical protein